MIEKDLSLPVFSLPLFLSFSISLPRLLDRDLFPRFHVASVPYNERQVQLQHWVLLSGTRRLTARSNKLLAPHSNPH